MRGLASVMIGLVFPLIAGAQDKPHPKSKLVITRDVTGVTGPVTEEGWINYAGAVENFRFEGVTRENNGAGLILRSIWIEDAGAYKALGVPTPASPKGLIRPLDKWGLDYVCLGPWRGYERPEADSHVDECEAALERVHKALAKPHLVFPMRFQDSSDTTYPNLLEWLLTAEQACRTVGKMLIARAMRSMGHGDWNAASRDLIAARTLARKLGRRGTFISLLIGHSIERMAAEAERACLTQPQLTVDDLRAYRKSLAGLPPRYTVADSHDQIERLLLLGVMQNVLRGELPSDGSRLGELTRGLLQNDTDPTPGMRIFNQWQDRILRIMRITDRAQSVAAWRQLDQDINSLAARVKANPLGDRGSKPNSEHISEQLGRIFVALLTPAVSRVFDSEQAAIARDRVTTAGIAMVEFRADTGRFPRKVEQLVPRYLGEIPIDPLTGEPLQIDFAVRRISVSCVGIDSDADPFRKSFVFWWDKKRQSDYSTAVLLAWLGAVFLIVLILAVLTSRFRRATRKPRKARKVLIIGMCVGVVLSVLVAAIPMLFQLEFRASPFLWSLIGAFLGSLVLALSLDRFYLFKYVLFVGVSFFAIGFMPWWHVSEQPWFAPVFQVYRSSLNSSSVFISPFFWGHVTTSVVITVLAVGITMYFRRRLARGLKGRQRLARSRL